MMRSAAAGRGRLDGLAVVVLFAAALAVAACGQSSASADGAASGAHDASLPPGSSSDGGEDAGPPDGAGPGADAAARDAAPRDGSACPPVPKTDAGGDCTAPLAPGEDRVCTMVVAGQAREVLLYAPATYDPCTASALIVDAHGSNETDAMQAGLVPFADWPGGLGSGWRLLADREGFVVAQPQGIGDQWTQADADFMLQIPVVVGKAARIDAKRVYMTGISNGGGLTYWTACRDTPVFAAFASVSGYGAQACPITHPAPLIHFHSPDDLLVPLSDGQAAFQMWVKSNHCARGPVASWTFGGAGTDPRPVCLVGDGAATPWKLATCDPGAPPTTCQLWDTCDGGVEALFCTVAPDKEHHYAETGGHVLYVNGTHLSLAAVSWELMKKLP